ncbi:XTP/dITP diphosphatase [Bacillus sp. AGMB 02131]|uniref:dITP/XTP pyrophosphatase n=1 Tax=Peribacillus faecalis TaxID=2772559 RepID=A0A927CWD7_9BACI|nr:XTP/dITP diphosphatase [Peribacillus faecalis]MBD3108394.1 XTP/dITP diphosphatase [Peribacillus faecalis]
MKKIIIATGNKGKAREFATLFSPLGYDVLTLHDLEGATDVEETGSTFEENAILKAEALCEQFNTMVISDDSGLMIDALDGRPGVYSARYAGEQKNDDDNIDKVLEELKGVPEEKRTARFYCALAVAIPGQETITVSGTVEGRIANARQGENGFGYDPVFYVPTLGKMMAELKPEEKNAISHRANALKKLKELLPTLL